MTQRQRPEVTCEVRERAPLGVLPYQKSLFEGDDAVPSQRVFDLFAGESAQVETEVLHMPPRPEFGTRKDEG